MNYIYSPSTNSFYPIDMQPDYEAAGSWPLDGIEVEDSVFQEFTGGVPPGKMRASGPDGTPIWVDLPPLTPEEELAAANSLRASLLQLAGARIAPLQDAVDLGIATAGEEAALLTWKRYRVELNRLPNVPGWPSDIQWPAQPEGE